MELTFTEMGKAMEETGLEVKKRNSVFGSMSLQVREEVWAGDIKLGVIILYLVFKAMNLDEITKGMSRDRKEV